MNFTNVNDFLLNTGLYNKIKISKDDLKTLNKLFFDELRIDAYCPQCGKSSIFIASKLIGGYDKGGRSKALRGYSNEIEEPSLIEKYEKFKKDNFLHNREFKCSRNDKHLLMFIFMIENINNTDFDTIEKIGQYPSLKDLNELKIERYRKILPNKKYLELNTALGLYSHGIGIGSLIYLRRIFEYLINEAYKEAKVKEEKWNDERYITMGVKTKIKILKNYLPDYMNDHKEIYSIMSKGVHKLSENECKKIFTPVKVGLLLILEEKYRQREEDRIIKENSAELNKIHSNLS